jgi:RNA polymerase sigma-70 factor, ECF subfamily
MTDEPQGVDSDDDASRWIISIAQQRDRASFILLFASYAPKVKAYLLRHTRDSRAAEDLTQEVFLNIWRKADRFDPQRASAAGWIYTMARNLQIDALRREHRHNDDQADNYQAEEASPEEQLRVHQSEQQLRSAIQRLPAEQAEVLCRAFFEEQTHTQIADALGVPLGTVKSRIRLATSNLRRALEDLV